MFQTSAPNDEWMSRLRARQFTSDTVFPNDALEALKRKLLTFGGVGVVLAQHEPHIDDIMGRGKIESGIHAMRRKGAQSSCHDNAHRLWRANPQSVKLCTGWALSRDGLWRQHSWARSANGKIIETTVRRVAYFGFDLTDEEAQSFGP